MIVSVEELQDYMSEVTLTPAQIEAAADVIAGVQAEIETYLNRRIERGTWTETVTTDANGYAFLGVSPVSSVTSVVYNSMPYTATYTVYRDAVQLGIANVPVTITYTGGYDGRNEPALKLAVLRVASREMQNRHDDTLSVKDLNTNDVAPLPEGLQDEDKKRIERYRRRVIV